MVGDSADMMLHRPSAHDKALTLGMLHAGNKLHSDDEHEGCDEDEDEDAEGGERTDEEDLDEEDDDDEEAEE